jgi:hypothetical protein
MVTGPKGRSGGGYRTDGGRGLWAERRAPPAGVVEEAGWARVGDGGDGPAVAGSHAADPVAVRSWAADPVTEAPPKPGETGRRRGKATERLGRAGWRGRGSW